MESGDSVKPNASAAWGAAAVASVWAGTGPNRAAKMLAAALLAALLVVAFLPADALAGPETFGFVADTHIGAGKSTVNDTKKAFKYLKKQPNLEAVINCGDLTDTGGEREYQNYLALWEGSGITARRMQVIGNHDNACGGYQKHLHKAGYYGYSKYTGRNLFRDYINGGRINTVERYGHANVICIGDAVGVKGGVYSKSTVKWLKKQLKKTAKEGKWAVVVTHYAPWHGTDDKFKKRPARQKQIVKACRSYKNVIYVCGHEHKFEQDKKHFKKHYEKYDRGSGKYAMHLLCLNSVSRVKGFHAGKANPTRHSYVYTVSFSADGKRATFKQYDQNKKKVTYKKSFKKR